jgi:hypothetical protein
MDMYIVLVTHWSTFGSGGLVKNITLVTSDFKHALSVARNIEKDNHFDIEDENGNYSVTIYDLKVDERYREKHFNWYANDDMPAAVVMIRYHRSGKDNQWFEQWSERALEKMELFKEFSESLKDVPDYVIKHMLYLDEIRRWRMGHKVYDVVSKENQERESMPRVQNSL